MKLRAELSSILSTTLLDQWLHWFLADRETRLISPSASVNVAEYLKQRIEDDSLESLTQALRLAPLDPKILSRLGRKLLIANSTRTSQRDRAEWLTRLALQLAPEDPSVWWLRADVLEAFDQLEESRTALSHALKLAPDDPNVWFVKALVFRRAGETETAYETYLKVLALVSEGGQRQDSATAAYLQEGLREIRAAVKLDSKKYVELADKRQRLRTSRSQIEADWLLRKAKVTP
jgi:Flp pilus assembly protein TadD